MRRHVEKRMKDECESYSLPQRNKVLIGTQSLDEAVQIDRVRSLLSDVRDDV